MTRTERDRKIRIESARLAPIELDGMVCEDCRCPEVMTVAAGQDVEVVVDRDVSLLGEPIGGTVIVRAAPPRGWCLTCGIRHGWFKEYVGKSKASEAIPCVG